jgi:hypothetical protein
MTWSYSGNPASSRQDKVRFLIGDTDPDMGCTLSNEEIDSILKEDESDTKAAAYACEALRAKAIGLMEYEKADRLKELCSELKDRFARTGV